MPAKIARLATRPPFWIPEVSVAVRSSRPSCSKAEKREYSWQIGSHPGNPGQNEKCQSVLRICNRNICGTGLPDNVSRPAKFSLALSSISYKVAEASCDEFLSRSHHSFDVVLQ